MAHPCSGQLRHWRLFSWASYSYMARSFSRARTAICATWKPRTDKPVRKKKAGPTPVLPRGGERRTPRRSGTESLRRGGGDPCVVSRGASGLRREGPRQPPRWPGPMRRRNWGGPPQDTYSCRNLRVAGSPSRSGTDSTTTCSGSLLRPTQVCPWIPAAIGALCAPAENQMSNRRGHRVSLVAILSFPPPTLPECVLGLRCLVHPQTPSGSIESPLCGRLPPGRMVSVDSPFWNPSFG